MLPWVQRLPSNYCGTDAAAHEDSGDEDRYGLDDDGGCSGDVVVLQSYFCRRSSASSSDCLMKFSTDIMYTGSEAVRQSLKLFKHNEDDMQDDDDDVVLCVGRMRLRLPAETASVQPFTVSS